MSIFLCLTFCFSAISVLSLLLIIQTSTGSLVNVLAIALLLINIVAWAITILQIVRPISTLREYVKSLQLKKPFVFTATRSAEINAIQLLIDNLLKQMSSCTQEEEKARLLIEKQVKTTEEALVLAEEKKEQNENLFGLVKMLANKAKDSFSQVHNALMDLSNNIAEIDNGVQAQHFELGTTSELLENILQSVKDVAEQAMQAKEAALASQEKASLGINDVQETVQVIKKMETSSLVLKDSMQSLVTEVENITSIMNVISDVADQTNLLALNAAIEAARAGESGKGFAVVADEVRNLAERTMKSTSEVARAVQTIQHQTKQNMDAVDEAAKNTAQGADLASKIGRFMTEIIKNMTETSEYIEKIAFATQVQSQSSHEVGSRLSNLNTIGHTTVENMTNITGAALQVSSHMEGLELIIHGLSTGDATPKQGNKLVEWTPKLATNIRLIDDQHKVLCNMINELHATMITGGETKVLHSIVSGLEKYARTHFNTEEQIFTHSKYPNIEKHKEIHRRFVSKVEQVKNDLQAGKVSVSIDLLNFLKDWLISHIEGTDLGYVKYLKK